MKKIIIILFIIFFFIQSFLQIILFAIIFMQWADFSISDEIIYSEVQPDNIVFDSINSYSLYIIRRQKLLDKDYNILISKDIEPSYGHVINYIDNYVISENDVTNTKLNWTNDGIEIHFPSGHILKVPKANFIGGR